MRSFTRKISKTYETIEELNFLQEHVDGGLIILDDLYENEMNDPRIQAMIKSSIYNLSRQ